ncbi:MULTISPECIES: DUF1501 domain-containing protein [unclassified Schlesneria]|uniref:DUF1501 domain-containing protein n=1 Tax=unclassified Schlesneria TaxID=2762017 RepID=UPI0035A03F46
MMLIRPPYEDAGMLRLLSSPRQLCNGLTRRELLEAGGTSLFGLSLPHLLQADAARAAEATSTSATKMPDGFGQAKRCIILFLYGSPSQMETVDMKPEAPVEIRGTMKPIPSVVPGLDVCEHMPNMARMMDRVGVLRSIHHEYPIHGVAHAMTGTPVIDVNMELSPNDPKHHPYFGSAVEYIDRQRRGGMSPFPQNVALPFPFSSQRTGEVHRAGPYAAYLGSAYNPVWTEFEGRADRSVYKTLGARREEIFDPYVGCTSDAYFRMASTSLPAELTLDRLDRRRSLLQQIDVARRDLDQSLGGRSLSTFQQMAHSLIQSPAVVSALDVRQESQETRELYGMTLFGQSCLAARRMLDAGTRLVSVFWDEYGLAGDAWDTHWNHFPRMVDQLLPGLDKAFSGLVLDLDRRGQLDDTLVVCISEHGRTPKIAGVEGGGRDHWSQAYSALFAGGGIARGRVVGATDKHAGEVVSNPVGPKDVLATMYHLLGIEPHIFLPDRTGRPIPLVPETSRVITELLA